MSARRQMNPHPPPSSLTASTSSIRTFLERQIQGVVLGIDDAEEARIAKVLRAAATVENRPVQEDAHIVAVSEEELLDLIAIRLDRRLRVDDFHPRLRIETLREVVGERDPRVRAVAIAVDDHEPGRLCLDILPGDRGAFRRRERMLQIAAGCVVGRREAPRRECPGRHDRQVPFPRHIRRRPHLKVREVRGAGQRMRARPGPSECRSSDRSSRAPAYPCP